MVEEHKRSPAAKAEVEKKDCLNCLFGPDQAHLTTKISEAWREFTKEWSDNPCGKGVCEGKEFAPKPKPK